MSKLQLSKEFIQEYLKYFSLSSKSEQDQLEKDLADEMTKLEAQGGDLMNPESDMEKYDVKPNRASSNETDLDNEIALEVQNEYHPKVDNSDDHESHKNIMKDEMNRLAILDCIEIQFYEGMTELEGFFVKVCTAIRIWTIKVISPDPEADKRPPIVFIHGFCSGSALWTKLMKKSAEKRHCYFIDLPGFGKSSRPSFSDNLDVNEAAMCDFLENWRIQLFGQERQILLVGHSMGGYLCGIYALRYGKFVESIILVDSWGWFSPKLDSTDYYNIENLSLFIKVAHASAKYFYPMAIMRKAGVVGKFLLKNVRKELYEKFDDLVSSDAFYDYLFYINCGEPTGEHFFKTIQENSFFAKKPVIDRCHDLAPHIKVSLFVGSKSFVNKLNKTVGQQLISKLGNERATYELFQGKDHHLYGDNEFITYFTEYLKTCY